MWSEKGIILESKREMWRSPVRLPSSLPREAFAFPWNISWSWRLLWSDKLREGYLEWSIFGIHWVWGCNKRMNGGEEDRKKKLDEHDPLEVGREKKRGCSRQSASKLGMIKLGEWVWRKGECLHVVCILLLSLSSNYCLLIKGTNTLAFICIFFLLGVCFVRIKKI